MHPLLRLPYAAATHTAEWLASLASGDGKVPRTLALKRAAVTHIERWAATSRDVSRPLLWVHAPSVGEGLMARPVIAAWRAQHPDWQIAFTFASSSAESFAARVGADVWAALPFDTGRAADRLLAALRPTILAVSKVDVWPVLTERAHAAGVRTALFSAAMRPGSERGGALARALLGDAYAELDAVGAIASADGDRLIAAGVRRVVVRTTGDTRYDQVIARVAAVDRASALLAPIASDRPTLVAGSTWPSDEAALFAAWSRVRAAVPGARLMIAPHEPTEAHLAPIERAARSVGGSVARLAAADAATDMVIVDRLGVLAELYALATIAYVGGGFHGAGLHSVVEPAAFGVPVLFGPQHTESRDAALLLEAGAGFACTDADALAMRLLALLAEPSARSAAGARALAVVDAERGAVARTVALLSSLVDV
ncbi:MAG: hypothetical protein K2X99_08535 [Gemmatimonadaceae bacterium]|nr:hypothetical protein [Gemmatimonadaceae bacterium]